MNIEIPKIEYDDPGPGWISVVNSDGKTLKPVIKCNCGSIVGIGLHHVHSDGTVTASFFHDVAPHLEIGNPGGGCGWHVFLKLKNYNYGEFPPVS